MEVADRAGRSGGHLALRGGLILRGARCPPDDRVLPGRLAAPLLQHEQPVDRPVALEHSSPTMERTRAAAHPERQDGRPPMQTRRLPSSPPWAQPSGCSRALVSSGSRGPAAVKTTQICWGARRHGTHGRRSGVPATVHTPLITLDGRFYKQVPDLDARFPAGRSCWIAAPHGQGGLDGGRGRPRRCLAVDGDAPGRAGRHGAVGWACSRSGRSQPLQYSVRLQTRVPVSPARCPGVRRPGAVVRT